jgi:plasmid stabilization system protein ParE
MGLAASAALFRFPRNGMRKIASDPKVGRLVDGHASARTYFVKWPKAKHGHYIVYRIISGGIEIIRILHGAMNFPDHLDFE